jgi:hypothetical protein
VFRKREHQAVGEFDATPITIQRGREPASDAAIIKLHFLLRSKAFEYALALLFGQAPEIKLVVITQEQTPLCGRGPWLCGFERLEWSTIRGCQCVKQILIDLKIKHHLHAIAVLAKILHIRFG